MASGWWGGLTEQISSMAKDVLTEGTEEIDDHVTALQLEQKKTTELQTQNNVVKSENESLKNKLSELNDSLHSADLQISAVSSQYKGLLHDKEEEVKTLRHTIDELNESNRSLLSSSSTLPARGRSHYHHFNRTDHSHTNGELLDETEDITDILSHQQEINRLNAELERSRAEVLHWKRESKRTSTPQEGTASQAATDNELENERLSQQIQSVEERLLAESDKHQRELSSIEELNRQRLAGLQESYTTQIDDLKSQLAEETVTVSGEENGEESKEDLLQRIQQLEVEGVKLYEQLQQSQEELSTANDRIAGYIKGAQDDQTVYKKQLYDSQEQKMASLRCVSSTLHHVRQREKQKKWKLKSAVSKQQEESAELLERLNEKERECTEYKVELEGLREEGTALNQSLTDLDQEHDVIVSQLIQQKDVLKQKNSALSTQLTEQGDRCIAAERKHLEASNQLENLRKDSSDKAVIADEKVELERKLAECQQELVAANQNWEELGQQRDKAEEELVQLKESNKSLRSEVEQFEAKFAEVNNNFTQSRSELGEVRNLLDHSQTLIGQLKGDLDQSQNRNLELDRLIDQLKSSNGDLNGELSQSQTDNAQLEERIRELNAKHEQSQSRVASLDVELNQSKGFSDGLNQSEVDSHLELQSLQKKLEAKSDENASLQSSLGSLNLELDTSTNTIAELKLNISTFQHDISDLNQQVSDLTQHLVTKDTDISSLNEQLEGAQAKLHEYTQSNNSLAEEVKEKTAHVGELQRDLTDRLGEISSYSSQLEQLQHSLDHLNTEHGATKLDLNLANAELNSRGVEIDTLKSELVKNAEAKAMVDAEVAELTSQLASSSMDSESTDPEPSEEHMESPRDSCTSLTEVQELKTQLDELQELLAQKVLLINELKGDEEDDTESLTSPSTTRLHDSNQSLEHNDCEQASLANEKCKHELQLAQLSMDRDEMLREMENLRSQLSLASQTCEELRSLKKSLSQTEIKLHGAEDTINSLRNSSLTTETALSESAAEVERLGLLLKQAQSNASQSAAQLGAELSHKAAEIGELQAAISKHETTILLLTKTSQEADDKLTVLSKTLQTKLDEQSAIISSANDTLRLKEEKITDLMAEATEATRLQAIIDEHLEDIGSLTASLVARDSTIQALHDRLNQSEACSAELRSNVAESGNRLSELEGNIAERDVTISDLKKLCIETEQKAKESPVKSSHNLSTYADPSALAEQLRAMEVEREQMSGVLSEKSREITGLKKQLHSLMDMNSSRDAKDAETAEMTKNTVRKLSSIVNERDVEIDALKQKNDSLVTILQTSGGPQTNGQESTQQISQLLEERQMLTQQMAALTGEREQLLSALQIKHQEAVSFHAEAVRLATLLREGASVQTAADSGGELEKLRAEYHERKQQLVETQHKLSEYKQKCSELTTQLESAARTDNVPKSAYDSLKDELEAIKARLEKQKEALLEKDKTYEGMQLRLSSQSESQSLLQTECGTLRKQIENLTFELSETRAERDDKIDSHERLHAQLVQHDSTIRTLRSTELELQRSVKDRERELTQLSSQVSGKEVNKDVEQEKVREYISTLTSERDTAHLTAQQNYQACQDLQAELSNSKERILKLEREVDRLRSHLMSIEEGYTADLLQSEEREKELRNRLATAEEKSAHTSTAVQHASLEASKQISSLEEQLHSVAAQRDESLLQLSTVQEQCSQYSTQLANLELVLEQFQAEKDSMHAAELNKLHSVITENNATITSLQSQLGHLRGQLDSQCEALEAAQRLTQQLEKKEEAMNALRDEVGMRESSLREAEERIRRLSSGNESKVEKLLMKNLIVNWHTAPGAKKLEVLLLMARVLNFTEDEKGKVGLGNQPGWIGGIWQRIAHPAPTSPAIHDRSFSEMFVKFLESESTPKPAPLPLPIDRMVEEEKQRAEQHHRAAFNPFVAPAGTVNSSATSVRQQAHPLLVGVPRDGSPLYTASQPMGNSLTLSPQLTNQLPASQPPSNQNSRQQTGGLAANPLTMQHFNSLTTNTLAAPQTSGLSLTPIPMSSPASIDNSVRFVPIPTTSTPS